jgi:hypothetical protein
MLEFLFGQSGRTAIRLLPVNLGTHTVRIPVADIAGKRPGKTLLVTGGTDGDEYAGMAAAYRLVEKYADGNLAGRLVVVPILNTPGFEDECSQNPLDGKFPKLVGLGRSDGTATERLKHWLVESYATGSNAWLDLHGGSITEGVRPFVWLFETGVAEADLRAQTFFRSCGAEMVLFERAGNSSKAAQLASRGCVYILCESGARGGRDEEDVERHVRWVEAMMDELGMANGQYPISNIQSQLLRHVSYVCAPFAGIWQPSDFNPETIAAGEVLGRCVRLDGTSERTLVAPASGVGLWWKETMAMREGDVLCAIGSR